MHSNLYLPQLLTPITLSVVAAVCARSHHQASDTDDTFVLPKFVGYLMIACGLVFCAIPFLPRPRGGDLSAAKFYLICVPFWGGAFLAAAYFFRYRVVITANTLTVGAFRRRTISFEDVVDYDVLSGRYSPELVVYLRSGKKFTLSGMLPDFDELVGLINSHMAIPPRGSETVVRQSSWIDRVERATLGERIGLPGAGSHCASWWSTRYIGCPSKGIRTPKRSVRAPLRPLAMRSSTQLREHRHSLIW